jgi:hypothetical protein
MNVDIMKNFNYKYINTHFELMEAFLFKAGKCVLDISYRVAENQIIIQVVLLKGFVLSLERIENVKKKLVDFDVDITELYLTKEQFNESKGDWPPQYYKWLNYLLFSKAEVL